MASTSLGVSNDNNNNNTTTTTTTRKETTIATETSEQMTDNGGSNNNVLRKEKKKKSGRKTKNQGRADRLEVTAAVLQDELTFLDDNGVLAELNDDYRDRWKRQEIKIAKLKKRDTKRLGVVKNARDLKQNISENFEVKRSGSKVTLKFDKDYGANCYRLTQLVEQFISQDRERREREKLAEKAYATYCDRYIEGKLNQKGVDTTDPLQKWYNENRQNATIDRNRLQAGLNAGVEAEFFSQQQKESLLNMNDLVNDLLNDKEKGTDPLLDLVKSKSCWVITDKKLNNCLKEKYINQNDYYNIVTMQNLFRAGMGKFVEDLNISDTYLYEHTKFYDRLSKKELELRMSYIKDCLDKNNDEDDGGDDESSSKINKEDDGSDDESSSSDSSSESDDDGNDKATTTTTTTKKRKAQPEKTKKKKKKQKTDSLIGKKILWLDESKKSVTYKKYIRGTIIEENIGLQGRKEYVIEFDKEHFRELLGDNYDADEVWKNKHVNRSHAKGLHKEWKQQNKKK